MPEHKNISSTNDKKLISNVSITLLCKIIFIICLGFLFFGSDTRIETTPQTVSQALLADTDSGQDKAADIQTTQQ